MREFETGATRDDVDGKLDFEGFISPLVLEKYCEYMDRHRVQSDGNMRASDNWQKGIPRDQYMKSAWRHFMLWWMMHRGYVKYDSKDGHRITMEEAISGVLFNSMGYMFELLTENLRGGVENNGEQVPEIW